jgi:chromosome segregation ATPase
MVTKRQRRRQATVQQLKIKLRELQEERASYGGEQSEVQKLRSEQEKLRKEHAAEMAVLQEKMAEQASRHEKEHGQLKELLRQSRQGVQKYGMAVTAVGNEAQIELEAKLHESEGKVEALETEVRRLRQGCQPGAVLPKELKENDRLKAELAEMQKELSAYGGERQGEEAMEEFHDCQTQEDWTRMESQLTAEQMEKSNLQMEHTAKQMELSQMQMALKEAEKQATVAEAQKDLQIRDSALRAERDATNVEFTAGLIESIAEFNMGWFRPTQ